MDKTPVVIAIVLAILVQGYQATLVEKCAAGFFPAVTVVTGESEVCVTPPCKVILGQDMKMTVKFTAPSYLENLKPQMLATAVGVKDLPYFVGDDACKNLINTSCPISEGEDVVYELKMNIPDKFPTVPVGLQFSIIDKDTDNVVTCFKFNINVER